jgi:hypothetical protein
MRTRLYALCLAGRISLSGTGPAQTDLEMPVYRARFPWLYTVILKTAGRKGMKTVLSFVAVAALAISVSSTARAAIPDGVRMANAQMHHHHWAPKKAHYGKRMRSNFSARCKMSGRC